MKLTLVVDEYVDRNGKKRVDLDINSVNNTVSISDLEGTMHEQVSLLENIVEKINELYDDHEQVTILGEILKLLERSKTSSSQEQLLTKIWKEQKKNNLLLSKMILGDNPPTSLPTNYENYVDKNLIIANHTLEESKEFAEALTGFCRQEISFVNGEDGWFEIASLLARIKENSYVFINMEYATQAVHDELLYALNDGKKFKFTVGKGPSSTTVEIEMPKVHFILYADTQEALAEFKKFIDIEIT